MHNYTAYAAHTIPANDTTRAVWVYKVPQESFRFPFLLHGILAFSAYHLAYLDHSAQQTSYHALARMHQTEAIHGMRDALPMLGQENCHALFVTSSLLALMAFTEKDSLIALVDISSMLRGMDAIIDKTEQLIYAGPFASLFAFYPGTDVPECLSVLLTELQGPEFARVAASSRVASVAAWELREAIEFCLKHAPYPLLRAVMLWPIRVDTKFWDVAREDHDWACKQVLKWYAAILEEAGNHWWFLGKWKTMKWSWHDEDVVVVA
ncbi:hypothetical protein NA57DRAFT_59711 [Rhizodiscina lignyota]|uniref:Uncharacterized protein n=1 Tax=Rhizodiscina lignyota TaxID=1504668 RepID=A0A9P4ICI6_9PEZI|nr:hypothetical protein NA57DRAFT_59711 [Rhizodiscina lignyota]